jgi:ASC-1-like (ASCH) protein
VNATVHELKCLDVHFDAIREGRKTGELRCDDRRYRVGDYLLLTRTQLHVSAPILDPQTGQTHFIEDIVPSEPQEQLTLEVTHKLDGGQYGLQFGWCMLSFRLHAHVKHETDTSAELKSLGLGGLGTWGA